MCGANDDGVSPKPESNEVALSRASICRNPLISGFELAEIRSTTFVLSNAAMASDTTGGFRNILGDQ
jgi:hypothetical protein